MKIEVGSFQQSIWLFSNFFTVDALQWVLICSTMIFTLGVCDISSSTCLYLRSSCPQTFNLFPYRAQTREPSYLSLPMCLYVSSLSLRYSQKNPTISTSNIYFKVINLLPFHRYYTGFWPRFLTSVTDPHTYRTVLTQPNPQITAGKDFQA